MVEHITPLVCLAALNRCGVASILLHCRMQCLAAIQNLLGDLIECGWTSPTNAIATASLFATNVIRVINSPPGCYQPATHSRPEAALTQS
jgi:hypothetical protein